VEDVVELTRELVENDLLILMKDGMGRFYNPEFNFNNIPGWNVAEGYMIKMAQAGELTLEGLSVLFDTPIDLLEGWQIVSYYPRVPVDAIIALSGLDDALIMAKDGQGHFYNPEWGFSNMGDMQAGQGYLLKMARGAELIYRLREEEDEILAINHNPKIPQHFPVITPTGNNMSLLIFTESQLAGEVGAFQVVRESNFCINPHSQLDWESSINKHPLDSHLHMNEENPHSRTTSFTRGKLVGSGVIKDGKCGLAVWGDDPTTEVIDGMQEGEAFTIALWNPTDRKLTDLDVTKTNKHKELIYETNGFTLIEAGLNTEVPGRYYLSTTYPNPFNMTAVIPFGLPDPGNVVINVYDISGRLIETLIDSPLKAGHHKLTWRAEDFSTGLYIVRMECAGEIHLRKVALIK